MYFLFIAVVSLMCVTVQSDIASVLPGCPEKVSVRKIHKVFVTVADKYAVSVSDRDNRKFGQVSTCVTVAFYKNKVFFRVFLSEKHTFIATVSEMDIKVGFRLGQYYLLDGTKKPV
jgi:hypothetical protein